MTRARRASGALVALLGLAMSAGADTYFLAGGDRVTGKTVSKAASGFTVQTPFGRLVIPRAKVERIVHDDGTEESVSTPPRPPTPVHLAVAITGKTFWYAWGNPEGVDPTLRLQVTLEGDSGEPVPLATYADAHPDPREIPGALVNFFSFAAQDCVVVPGPGVQAAPPEMRPGKITLKLDLPAERAGHGRVHVFYQLNAGSETTPVWVDLVETRADVDLAADKTRVVEIEQDRGRMEYSGFLGVFKHHMKNVETFTLTPHVE